MKKLLVIDSNSIINRAFYGIRHLTAKDGTPTNAVYGFLNILFKLIEENKPDYICAAFDVKQPTFRHKQFDAYKAQRKPMPDDLAVQMPIAKEILQAMNVSILEKAGYEADDIIGTVSRMCEKSGVECLIATGDKDDLQLATDKTKVILTVTRSGMNETIVYDENAVKEKYGVTPTEFIDVKALMGDPSDNIPGVAGVGEKTALSLISKFNCIEYIYDHIDEVGLKGAMLKKMQDGKDMAFLSKQLATIDIHVPIELNLDEFAVHSDDLTKDASEELYSILKRLDLNNFIKKLGLIPEEKPSVDILEGAQMHAAADKEALEQMIETLRQEEEVSCLFLFAGKELSGFSAAVGKQAYYASIGMEITKDMLIAALVPLLEDKKVKKILYDGKDAMVYFAPYTKIEQVVYDVAIAAYLVDPARSSYTIDSIALEYLNVALESEEEVFGKGRKQISIFDVEEHEGMEFACKRALAVAPLREATQKKLEANRQAELYYSMELPLVEVLADMQVYGFAIDHAQLDAFTKLMDERLQVITAEIYNYAGEEFNINSPKQLGVILFEKLGLHVVKKTKTGYSTNVEVLEKLKGEHPIIEHLMEYRQISKLKSTYCDGLRAVIHADTGRIHSVFTQTVTVTGRISSTEPNMQNIPVRTELGREMRKMFITDKEDYVLVDADYSQIELRVLAHIADDDTMKHAFLTGEDIHAVTASQVFGVPLSEVTPEQRSSAKAVNFGIVYGIGEFSLSQNLKIPVAQAKQYIQNYLAKYHGVREYMERIKEQAKKDGYVTTLMNRIRYIPELKSSNYNVRAFGERVALNTPIQGTAADIIKLAMVRVHKRLKEEGLLSRLILQVHDELIVETYKPELDRVKAILKDEMEHAMELSVPLVVDMASGKSWYDAK